MKKAVNIIFLMTTMLLLVTPIILMLFGVKNANRENRILASFPSLIKDGGVNLGFASEFNDFLDDNFASKEHLVTAYNVMRMALFSEAASKKVIYGKEDMLFFSETLNDYTGVNQLTDRQLRSIAAYLKNLEDTLAERGIKMLVMLAPNKASVYPELMPDRLFRASETNNMDRLQMIMNEMKVSFLDAKSLLISSKDEGLLYYYHDSHWNNFAATIVYNALAEEFLLSKHDVDAYEIKTDYIGDLHNFVMPAILSYENQHVYSFDVDFKAMRPIDFDRYKLTETTSDANELEAVFFHDSFGRSLQPYLSRAVGRLTMSSVFPYELDRISDSTDIVIIEIVERNIHQLLRLFSD